MRVLAFDLGEKRTGVAISDASGTLARPWRTLTGTDTATAHEMVRELQDEVEGLVAIVVGLPKRLDGTPTPMTDRARAFAASLEGIGLPVVLQDERLTSVDAESRLARRERDWRKRKAKLDAASAAVLLQDYLDQRAREAAGPDAPGGA
jgi:putative Holliday junction resolvase